MTTADFAVPIGERYFEDYTPGSIYEYGTITVTEPEIIEFAKQFDPQAMHIDPEWARQHGRYGGIIASGWHTVGLAMRLFVDNYMSKVASLASPGVDEVRWPNPVRPGDTLRLRLTILDTRPSRTKPDRGIIRTRFELINQNDEIALGLIGMSIVGRRPPRS